MFLSRMERSPQTDTDKYGSVFFRIHGKSSSFLFPVKTYHHSCILYAHKSGFIGPVYKKYASQGMGISVCFDDNNFYFN
jgi:hypothetical protein